MWQDPYFVSWTEYSGNYCSVRIGVSVWGSSIKRERVDWACTRTIKPLTITNLKWALRGKEYKSGYRCLSYAWVPFSSLGFTYTYECMHWLRWTTLIKRLSDETGSDLRSTRCSFLFFPSYTFLENLPRPWSECTTTVFMSWGKKMMNAIL